MGWFCAGEMGLCWGRGVGSGRGVKPDGMGKREVVGFFLAALGGLVLLGCPRVVVLVSWFLSSGLIVIGLGSLGSDFMVFLFFESWGGRFCDSAESVGVGCWGGCVWSCAVGT